MAGLALPMDIQVKRNQDMLDLVIVDQGVLTMPREAAHQLAQDLMQVIGEIDVDTPRIILPRS